MPDAPKVSPASVVLPEGGKVRPMTRWGTPVMHTPQQPVTSYDEELRELVADMTATMYAAEGVGLAACQIGVDRAVFVFDCPDDDGVLTRGVVCNPEIELPASRGEPRRARDAGAHHARRRGVGARGRDRPRHLAHAGRLCRR